MHETQKQKDEAVEAAERLQAAAAQALAESKGQRSTLLAAENRENKVTKELEAAKLQAQQMSEKVYALEAENGTLLTLCACASCSCYLFCHCPGTAQLSKQLEQVNSVSAHQRSHCPRNISMLHCRLLSSTPRQQKSWRTSRKLGHPWSASVILGSLRCSIFNRE